MAGEHILVVDDSQGIQDIVRATLMEYGYTVEVASNGVAALSHPNLKSFSLLILDTDMATMSGRDTVRLLRSNEATSQMPALLLVPENKADDRANISLGGAWGHLIKPFEPSTLLRKVKAMIEEQRILQQSEAFISSAADKRMQQLAESQIQAAVERKTQIIIERVIQNVITQVDQRARIEVDQRITQLSAEKEQELVRMTVREVANSMVEKLAERKVNEAIELVLHERTEAAVRRAADLSLPQMCSTAIKEQLELKLPEAVEAKVSEVAQNQASEIGAKLVSVVEGVAVKSIPKIINEKLPDLAEKHLNMTASRVLPPIVQEQAKVQLEVQSETIIKPQIDQATRRIKAIGVRFLIFIAIIGLFVLGSVIVMLYMTNALGQGQTQLTAPSTRAPRAAATPKPATTP